MPKQPKLTDTQLIILSMAAGRSRGAVLPLSGTLKLKGGAATTTIRSLLKRRLIAEVPAKRGEETWRNDGDTRLTLHITARGLEVLGIDPGEAPELPGEAVAAKRDKAAGRKRPEATPEAAMADGATDAGPRAGTRLAVLLELLQRPGGATIAEMCAATGWQAHSVRGAMSGALKKKLGIAIDSALEDERGRVYRA